MRKNRACALGGNRWQLRSPRQKKIVYSVAIILIILWELCLNKQTRKPAMTCLGCLSIHIYSIAVLFGLNHKSPKITGFTIWWVLVLATCGAINSSQSLSLKFPAPGQRDYPLAFSILSTQFYWFLTSTSEKCYVAVHGRRFALESTFLQAQRLLKFRVLHCPSA